MRSKSMSKAPCFQQITAKLKDYPFFTVFLIIKTPSQNISITLLKISLKSHELRGCYCWKKLPWTILENSSQCREILLHVKEVMASFRCYDNCDVIETLIILLLTPGNFSKSLFIATEFILKRRRYWPWITAPSHKCNNKLDCFFARNVANYGQFFHKIKFARTFKKCARSGSRKYFFCHY